MVLTAEELAKERDRINLTPTDRLDAREELARLDDLVLQETRGFFERILGTPEPWKKT
jgi:hypothetical protein